MEATLVFPHQLFYPNPSLSKRRKTFLIEDPLFLSDSRYPAVFHKQKIMLHFLSMRSFKEKLNAVAMLLMGSLFIHYGIMGKMKN